MADRGHEEGLGTDAKVRRGVRRTIVTALVVLVSLGVLIGWAASGIYKLSLGESAVILRWGRFDRIETREGWNLRLPPPIEYHTTVNTSEVRSQFFGLNPSARAALEPEEVAKNPGAGRGEGSNSIQTKDRNIVTVAYQLQYTVDDAYAFAFGMAHPDEILHDATQAAVRDVVGHKLIDEALAADRDVVEVDSKALLDETLQRYFEPIGTSSAFSIKRINFQMVQAPVEVRDAFDDVVSAQQDQDKLASLARGDAQEILEKARGQAAEISAAAEAYQTTKVVEARGEAKRFEALLTEYQRAPKVTRERLYLETMEVILPNVEKVVVEPDTVNMFPTLPMGSVGVGAKPPAEPNP